MSSRPQAEVGRVFPNPPYHVSQIVSLVSDLNKFLLFFSKYCEVILDLARRTVFAGSSYGFYAGHNREKH